VNFKLSTFNFKLAGFLLKTAVFGIVQAYSLTVRERIKSWSMANIAVSGLQFDSELTLHYGKKDVFDNGRRKNNDRRV